MNNQNKNQVPSMFEKLFLTLSGDRFLNREGLGGNMPIFIQPYEISDQVEVDDHIVSLIKRLESVGIPILSINLYNLFINILKEKGTLKAILDGEQSKTKREFNRDLQGSANITGSIIPSIVEEMKNCDHKIVLIHGIDKIHPLVSIVPILSEVHKILEDAPFVFFFPGKYDTLSLTLFGCIDQKNEYRARNLDKYC
jgi:hypothetical protein